MKFCCVCNQPIEGPAKKVGKCPNDGVVFWRHPTCELSCKVKQFFNGQKTRVETIKRMPRESGSLSYNDSKISDSDLHERASSKKQTKRMQEEK